MNLKDKKQLASSTPASLSALTAAALVLHGLLQTTAHAVEEDSVDFQYSHYQEGKRDIQGFVYDYGVQTSSIQKLPQNLNPIEVDSIHGSGRFRLTDRIKFAFNYIQDTWSGATPIGTVPAIAGGNNPKYLIDGKTKKTTVTGASPYASPGNGIEYMLVDKKLNFYPFQFNANGKPILGKPINQLTHVMSYASPETRKQGDFKLSYEWDNAALDIGGGISIENDYESRFGNIGGQFDFNQKQTTFNWGLSYTNSDTFANLDPDASGFFSDEAYRTNLTYGDGTTYLFQPQVASGYVEHIYEKNQNNEFSLTL